ncbi:PucR family transcriptional regulator [Agrococcus jejuensis]|uniref:Putative transposase n=1 Tax=Agrococcus jejuensis TaxID=399736 RepID=A0A1G8A0G4_9MICO|nr:PucR family transcriptional regulator [Agrococcus jejuensis]SDH14444.1 putative transposase [Agrococcus jejuensis]
MADPYQRILDALVERTDEIAAIVDARIRDELPSYDHVPYADIATSVHANVALTVATVQAGAVPATDSIGAAEASSTQRVDQGVPIVDVMRGFRVCIRAIQEQLIAIGHAQGLSDARLVELTDLLWALSDAFTARSAIVYRDRDVDRALADMRRVLRFLQGLASGDLDAEERAASAARYGLPLDGAYRAFRARALDEERTEELRRQLHRGPRGCVRLAASAGTEILGIASDVPSTGRLRAVVGVGPAVSLGEAARSFAVARGVLDAARRTRRDGVHTLQDMTWRIGITTAPLVTAELDARLVAPVVAEGAFGDAVLEAVGAYLDHGRSIPEAAASVHVHVNTLRYRLRRFEELTGADLASTTALVETAWALEAHRGS